MINGKQKSSVGQTALAVELLLFIAPTESKVAAVQISSCPRVAGQTFPPLQSCHNVTQANQKTNIFI